MPKNIFRVFNPKGTQEDRTERRRAQLRHAQQTYRERKDRYTKALEQELAQGRAREAHLVLENARLHETIEQLRAALALAQSPVDGTANGTWPFGDPPPPPPKTDAFAYPNGASPAMLPSPASGTTAGLSPSTVARLGDLDPTDVGMEFVLTLEQPCLAHLHGDPDKPEESNNHALTVSGKLCSMSGAPETNPVTHIDYKAAPKAILESMLSLSTALAPDRGLTPVQAWHRVRARPEFARLELGSVQALAITLKDLVQCHGFGAVIEQEVFADQIGALLAIH
ncbi:hypothetical protein SEUCBS139899_007640 [Sporothrix eucalyptigena]|uniref:BZIP domain-containing protein n=1 Tax=Sporothrix eucalyptigena TaxID=1812306 RepID=A0ABP0AT82_9PEZI